MPDQERKTLSSTEMPKVLNMEGVDGTRWTVMNRFRGLEIPEKTHNYMDWGLEMQEPILRRAAAEFALEITPNPDGLYHRRNRMGYTADAWTRAPDKGVGIVEVKCCFNPQVWMQSWGGGKRVPRHIEIQHQTQLYVGDGGAPCTWGIIVAWFQAELFMFRREPDTMVWEKLEQEAEQFFADLAAEKYGEAFGAPSELPWLRALYQPQPGKVLDLSEPTLDNIAIAQDCAALITFTEDRKFSEKNEAVIKNKLRAIVKDNEFVKLPKGVTIRAKLIEKKAHSVKAQKYTQLDVDVPDKDGIPFDTPSTAPENPIAGG